MQRPVALAGLVETLDRMGSEGRRNRGVRAEHVAADLGELGHERVDQPQRGDLFLELVGLEPVDADPVTGEAKADGEGGDQPDHRDRELSRSASDECSQGSGHSHLVTTRRV
jgi:hypothetical protein